jgi:hypothetical protein
VTQVNAVRADMASRALKPVMGRSNITVGPGWLCTLVTVWILGGPPSFVLGTVGLFVVLGLCVQVLLHTGSCCGTATHNDGLEFVTHSHACCCLLQVVCFATVHKVVMDTSSGTPTATGVEFGVGNRGEKGTFTGEGHSHHNQRIHVPSYLQQAATAGHITSLAHGHWGVL